MLESDVVHTHSHQATRTHKGDLVPLRGLMPLHHARTVAIEGVGAKTREDHGGVGEELKVGGADG